MSAAGVPTPSAFKVCCGANFDVVVGPLLKTDIFGIYWPNNRTKRSLNNRNDPSLADGAKTKGPKRDSDGGGRRPRSRSSSLRVNSTQLSSSTGVIKMALPSLPEVRPRSSRTSVTTRSDEPSLRVESTQTVTDAHKKRMDDEYEKMREFRRKLQRRLEQAKREEAGRKRSDGKHDNGKGKLPYGEASNRCRLSEVSERKLKKSLAKQKKEHRRKRTQDSAKSEKEKRKMKEKKSSAKRKTKKNSDSPKDDGGHKLRSWDEEKKKKKNGHSKQSDEPKSSLSSSDGCRRRQNGKAKSKKSSKEAKRSKSRD